jgi:hypothetical protein
MLFGETKRMLRCVLRVDRLTYFWSINISSPFDIQGSCNVEHHVDESE